MTGMKPIATASRRSDGIGLAGHSKCVGASGSTLIEVLVTIAITSVGLIGMAGLMAISVKVNHDAYLNTQANFIAQSLIEAMHINISAVAQGRYDGTFSGASGEPRNCKALGCSPDQRASYDRARFDSAISVTLPNASGSIKCSPVGAPVGSPNLFDGTCRLEVGWLERALSAGSESPQQSLVWIFQP